MILLGIDPGTRIAGFGIIKKTGNQGILIDHGYASFGASKPLIQRVRLFHDFFKQKIIEYDVTHLAIETPFLHKNAQNFLKLGYLRGILYLLADQYNLIIKEFSPREVKQAVTGFGGAKKDQVARIVMQLLPNIPPPKKDDVTDALAVMLCGLWHKEF